MKPNEQGFITQWLVTSPKIEKFNVDQEEPNQLKYEHYLRSIIADDEMQYPIKNIYLGKKEWGKHSWKYYQNKGSWFVDITTTSATPEKIEIYATTQVVVEDNIEIKANIWTYAALDIWIEDMKVYKIKKPVYKPMKKEVISFKLHKGTNNIFIRMQNLGIRDTRNIFGIQLLEGIDLVTVNLPDVEHVRPILEVEEYLGKIKYESNKIIIPYKKSPEINITFSENNSKVIKEELIEIPKEIKKVVIWAEVNGHRVEKKIEVIQNYMPIYKSLKVDHPINQLQAIANKAYANRASGIKFSIYHVLARYALGQNTKQDLEYILEDLAHIERKVDCSDFLIIGIIRLMSNYKLPPYVLEKIKKVLLNFRYWMDEVGTDGMCFWSENHALLFYTTQMIVGNLYPRDTFYKSNRRGIEQHKIGKMRCKEWLDDVEKNGMEEFLSSTYINVTVAGLLSLIDFGEEELVQRATQVLDGLFNTISKHVFKGVVIAPQGRTYRDIINPLKQNIQALIHYINPDVPEENSMWLACFITSKYKIPNEVKQKMEEYGEWAYSSGQAMIRVKKNKDYILTSVDSAINNKNKVVQISSEKLCYQQVKELNERYHGTTLFEPGVYGYQQHLWSAALDNDCLVFSNHPGATYDESKMRPGYWYGNGLFPAVKQKGSLIGIIYNITEDYPIHFTHLYWPTDRFDEVIYKDKWLFGRKGNSYIGVWCNKQQVKHQDILFDREYRSYGEKIAYLCHCASKEEIGEFENFIKACKENNPEFDEEKLILSTKSNYILTFIKGINTNQYI